jgi:hypothetical protein
MAVRVGVGGGQGSRRYCAWIKIAPSSRARLWSMVPGIGCARGCMRPVGGTSMGARRFLMAASGNVILRRDRGCTIPRRAVEQSMVDGYRCAPGILRPAGGTSTSACRTLAMTVVMSVRCQLDSRRGASNTFLSGVAVVMCRLVDGYMRRSIEYRVGGHIPARY